MEIAVEVFEVIGAICAIITLLLVSYVWIYKLGGLVTKVDTIWKIYVMDSLSEAVRLQYTKRRSLYKITEEGKKILDEKIVCLISDFAKANKKFKEESDEYILDKFISSNEFKEIKGLIFTNGNVKSAIDFRGFWGLVFAYVIEKIKREE